MKKLLTLLLLSGLGLPELIGMKNDDEAELQVGYKVVEVNEGTHTISSVKGAGGNKEKEASSGSRKKRERGSQDRENLCTRFILL